MPLPRSKATSRGCSMASRRATRSASGCRRARPAKRPIRSPSCWANTRAGSRRRRASRSSRPTSTRTRSASDAKACIRKSIAADVSEDRLKRFFTREHRGYRVRREVRETVLFALHDVLRDSPFSRLDLVSCRNLLIYLNRDAQQKLFSDHALRAAARGPAVPRRVGVRRRGLRTVRAARQEAAGSTCSGRRRGPDGRYRPAPARWRECWSSSAISARRRREVATVNAKAHRARLAARSAPCPGASCTAS